MFVKQPCSQHKMDIINLHGSVPQVKGGRDWIAWNV